MVIPCHTLLASKALEFVPGSFERPYNHRMEPTRLRACAIMLPRRAAHSARYTDEERRHRIGWHRGGVGGRGVHRGASLLRRLGRASPAEHVRTFRSQAWQPKQNTSTSGSCQPRGCLGRSSRSSRWLAPLGQRRAVGVCRSRHRAPLAGRVHSSVAPARPRGTRLFRHHARLDRRAGSHRHRGRPSVAAAPLLGLFERRGTRRHCVRAALIPAAV